MALRLLAQAVLVLSVVLSGCSGSDSPRTREAPAAAAEEEGQTRKKQDKVVRKENKDYRYDPSGKPDPFRSFIKSFVKAQTEESPTSPLERFDLSQLNVSAIIWGTDKPRALINDPSGKGYIIAEGASIGKNRGRVIQIDDNLVVVKETYVDFHGKATTKDIEMRLHPVQGG